MSEPPATLDTHIDEAAANAVLDDPKWLHDSLIGWYNQCARDLPWRRTKEAYAIWLSEVMLQQTQVTTVLPYYDRFLTAFPTLVDLANAPQDQVLKLWEGLGYYSRARNLHKAAQHIRDHHNGVFPNTFEEVVALPGIGQSTAGAILTFAFEQPHPILDGNVKRVLARLLGIDIPAQETKAIQAMWEATTKLVPATAAEAYPWNQALMELGASLCSRTKPDCDACPWAERCIAKNAGMQGTLPRSKPKKQTPHHTIGVGIVWRQNSEKSNEVLIALRPEEGLLGGLWEFPGGKCKSDELITECITREILEETGLTVKTTGKLIEVKHAYSHFKITLHAYECEYISGELKPLASQALKWVTLDEIHQYAFPKANKRVLEALCHKPDRQLTLC